VQAIVETLQGEIAGGAYPPGSALPPERLIAERFGVSRNTVREAMRVLGSRGLVRVRHGSGVYVEANQDRQVSQSLLVLMQLKGASVRQVLDVRATLEKRCIELAARSAGQEDVARLRSALAAYDGATDTEALLEAMARFHCGIGDACGNPFLAAVERAFVQLLMDAQRRAFADEDFAFWKRWTGVYQEYRCRMADAVAAHDVPAALAVMDDYHRQLAREWEKAFRYFEGREPNPGELFQDRADTR
jgi:DNA-binding FadR family transcriptional regulator